MLRFAVYEALAVYAEVPARFWSRKEKKEETKKLVRTPWVRAGLMLRYVGPVTIMMTGVSARFSPNVLMRRGLLPGCPLVSGTGVSTRSLSILCPRRCIGNISV